MADRFKSETRIKRGQETARLTADDLFDKIINLKFIRWDKSGFVIRSDYEPVFQKDGSVYFIKCRQKPHISISYRQVSQETAIEVDIEVANLFIDKSQGNPWIAANSLLSDDLNPDRGNPVTKIVVQIGYFNQFPDWTELQGRQSIDLYYALYNNFIPFGEENKSGMQMTVTVLDTYTKGNPPDQITYFHGIIGTASAGLRWNHTAEDLIKNIGELNTNGKQGWLWNECYTWVTRRFIRPDVLHQVYTKYNADRTFAEQVVEIYGYHDYYLQQGKNEQAGLATAQLRNFAADAPSDRVPDTKWTKLNLENGMLSDGDAVMFGVPCILSAALRAMQAPGTPSYGQDPQDGALLPHQVVMSDTPQNNLGAQIEALCGVYEFLRYYVMPDGSYYFYHVDEAAEDLFMNTRIQGLAAAQSNSPSRAVLLPAIYDITYGGTRTIRCPFYYLISPMVVVFFMSKYYIGSLAGFYYHPDSEDNKYLVLQASIEFDTDGDANMMTLMCVDYPRDKPPYLVDGKPEWSLTESDEQKLSLMEVGTAANLAWKEENLIVVLQTRGPDNKIRTQTDSRWLNIAEQHLFAPLGPFPKGKRWKELWADYLDKGKPWFYKRAIEDLEKWNPDYFTGSRLQEPSSENVEWAQKTKDAPGGPVTAVPIIYAGDTIVYRDPWMPEYKEQVR